MTTNVPSTTGLTPDQQRIYKREDLSVLNRLKQPVFVFDIDKKAMWWANPPAIAMWNAQCIDSLLERNFAHDMSETIARRLKHNQLQFGKGETLNELWTIYPNGKRKNVTSKSSGMRIEDGRMATFVEVLDYSTKEAVEESEKASLRGVEMLRHLPVSVCQFDNDGNVMEQNPEAITVFGSPGSGDIASEIANHGDESSTCTDAEEGSTCTDCGCKSSSCTCTEEQRATTNPNDCHFLSRFVDKELGRRVLSQVRKGDDSSVEALQHTVNGPRWSAIRVRRTKDPVTTKPVILYSARDITEVVEAKKQADAANMAKSEFMAVMAHEIRTPLHQVTGFIELLGQTSLNQEQNDFVKLLQTSATSLMTIINDLLDFTKLEAGKMSLDKIPFNAKDVVQGALTVLEPTAEQKGLRLVGNLPDNIPEEVLGDPNRLRQILLNLLNNAVKFTNQGGATVAVSRKADTANGRIVLRFEIADTGVGISDEACSRIFRKYQQADASVPGRYGGTGLGLAICKSLAEAMDGSIGVHSLLGIGSTFWFEVSFDPPSTDHCADAEARKRAPSPMPETVGRQRVLLVEDNKINQKVMLAMLKRLGHEVTVADNGLKAVNAVQDNPYDLVLMDVQMPVMDGIAATKRIRAMGISKARLPILGLTASVERTDHQKIGMNAWLTKPLRVRDLKNAIRDSLHHRASIWRRAVEVNKVARAAKMG